MVTFLSSVVCTNIILIYIDFIVHLIIFSPFNILSSCDQTYVFLGHTE